MNGQRKVMLMAGDIMIWTMAICFSVCVVGFTALSVAGLASTVLDVANEVKAKALNLFTAKK